MHEGCPGASCEGPATGDEDLVTCPACGGGSAAANCPECNGDGELEIPGCAWRYVPEIVWDLLDAAETFKNGGGWPNSPTWAGEFAAVVDGINYVLAERRRIEKPRRGCPLSEQE